MSIDRVFVEILKQATRNVYSGGPIIGTGFKQADQRLGVLKLRCEESRVSSARRECHNIRMSLELA